MNLTRNNPESGKETDVRLLRFASDIRLFRCALAAFISIYILIGSIDLCKAEEKNRGEEQKNSLIRNSKEISINSGENTSDRVIVAAGDHNYPPYEFTSQNGEATGFNVDIFRAVCKEMNIKYRIELGPWNDVRKKLETGRIDLITGMYFSAERDKKVDFSTPHIIVSQSIFVRRGSKISRLEDLTGKEVIVQSGDIMDDFLQSQSRSLKIIRVTDQFDALRILSKGEHDCALLSKLQGLYLINSYKFDNLESVGPSILQRDYCFAVREGDARLLTQLNEGLALLRTKGIYREIHNRWFGVYEDEQNRRKVIKYLIWTTIPFLILITVVVLWNRTLKKLVHSATMELARSENRYREFVALAVDGIVRASSEGLIIEANQVLSEWLDLPGGILIGRHMSKLPWAEGVLEKSPFRIDLLNEGLTVTTIRKLIKKDGSEMYIEMRSKKMPDGSYQSIFRDITGRISAEQDRERLMSQLAQSQKMEAIGRLAGGIAHDFNNMLGVILGYTDMAMMGVKIGTSLHTELDGIKKAALRSSDLTRQLLAFARRQTIKPKILDINATIDSMLAMLKRIMGEEIALNFIKGKDEIWQVKMDPGQIDQILANLCVNARDAIDGTGKVTIETINITISQEYCAVNSGFRQGDYVLLSVSDNGRGMDRETLGCLFEPFFTTKSKGEGTGLGLSTVYGIVTQNNGLIHVYSEVDHGTTFRIYIPRCMDNLENVCDENKKTSAPAECGSGTILLVEDEPMLLELTHSILETLGYTVFSAGTPAEAIELSNTLSGEIDLLLTDVVMPEMNGKELAHKLTEAYPDLKYLFMSGYTANVIAHHGILDEGINFIQKPFSINDLAEKIREVLG